MVDPLSSSPFVLSSSSLRHASFISGRWIAPDSEDDAESVDDSSASDLISSRCSPWRFFWKTAMIPNVGNMIYDLGSNLS